MVERKRIGLIYSMDKDWIGGTYYILNLISALNTLKDEQKPIIVVVCKLEDDFLYVYQQTQYPYLEKAICRLPHSKIIQKINWLTSILFNKCWLRFPSLPIKVSILYPIRYAEMKSSMYQSISWCADLQDKVLPQFFTKKERWIRTQEFKKQINSNIPLVFSSENGRKDFQKYYPKGKHCKTFVMRFAVSLPNRDISKDHEILDKYKANSPYFFCANQFWAHKNHITLFRSIKLLKDKGINITVYFSGNTSDYRNPNFFLSLQKYIIENNLEQNIRILGFMDRHEQLCLMSHAEAIIQPSLFEGWSTVVEDAKALHKYVILSDIPLHREQLTQNVSFFNPLDSKDLANRIKQFINNKPKIEDYDYNDNIRTFGKCFYNIIGSLCE